MTTKSLSFLAAAVVFGGSLLAQTTYYVDVVNGASPPTNSGLTPSSAFYSLTDAAGAAQAGDTVIVMPGTYNLAVETAFPVVFGGSQNQDGINIIAAEGPSKTFIDGSGTYAGIGLVRFREGARGARISGFTFQNMADAYWSCAIRLGSSSGGIYRAWDVEVDNCVFDSTLSRGIVIFGSGSATAASTTGCLIHNNLFLNTHPNRRVIAMWGDGANYVYNNVIIHPTDTVNRAGIYIDALTAGPGASKAHVYNNIIVGGAVNGTNSAWGVQLAASTGTTLGGAGATVENNNVFNCASDYNGFTASASNLAVDPLFVSATDFRLQPTSPMIDKGTANLLPHIRHDPDGFPGNHGGAPDIGAYESHDNSFGVSIHPKLGSNAEFEFKGAPGFGRIYVSVNETPTPSINLPGLGHILIDYNFFLLAAISGSPGKFQIAVPNTASLEGQRLVFQGVYIGATTEALNVVHTFIRK